MPRQLEALFTFLWLRTPCVFGNGPLQWQHGTFVIIKNGVGGGRKMEEEGGGVYFWTPLEGRSQLTDAQPL